MYNILYNVIIFSVIGTLLGGLIFLLNLITFNVFSKRWNYYVSLISIAFFLGIHKLIELIIKFLNIKINTQKTFIKFGYFDYTKYNVLLREQNNIFICLIFSFWLFGVLIFLILKFKQYYNFKINIINDCSLITTKFNKIAVVESDFVSTPILIGITKPMIVLPCLTLDEKELKIIIEHELIHYRRGDLIVKFIIMFAKAIHWFNPFIFKFEKNIEFLCEISCDEKLIHRMDNFEKNFYVKTIILILEHSVTRRADFFIGLCNNKIYIKKRLNNIMESSKKRSLFFIFAIFVSILFMLLGITLVSAMSNIDQYKDVKYHTWFSLRRDPDPAIPNKNIPVYGQGELPNYPDWFKSAENVDSDPAILNKNTPIYGE